MFFGVEAVLAVAVSIAGRALAPAMHQEMST
jgi:hypothetical protein